MGFLADFCGVLAKLVELELQDFVDRCLEFCSWRDMNKYLEAVGASSK